MKKYLILFILVIIQSSALFSQYYGLSDVFNSNVVNYDHKTIEMEENACIDYNNLRISMPQFVLLTDTIIQSKINSYIVEMMKGQLEKVEFRKRLSLHAIQAEIAYFQKQNSKTKQLVTCDFNQSLYSPSITQVNYAFGILNHNILPFSVTYTYSASIKNNYRLVALRYVDLVYINVLTGKIYSPKDVFKPTSNLAVNTLISNKYKQKLFYLNAKEFNINQNSRSYYNSEYEEEYVSEEYEEKGYNDVVPIIEAIDEDYEEEDVVYEEEVSPNTVPNMRTEVYEPEIERPIRSIDSRGGTGYDGGNGSGYRGGESGEKDMSDNRRNNDYSQKKEKIIGPSDSRFYDVNLSSTSKMELKDFNHEKNGLLLSNAFTFQFIIPAFQPCNDVSFGKAVSIDLSLDEIKQHINPNGPFGFMLNYNQKSIKNQYQELNQYKTNAKTYEIGMQNYNIDLNPDNKVKKVEISVKNPHYLQTYRISSPNNERKYIIDSAQYVKKYYRTYNNGLLVNEKIMKLEHSTDINFELYSYTYNNQGNLTSKYKYQQWQIIEKDTFIYDVNNNLLNHKQYESSLLKVNTSYFYTPNFVYSESTNQNNMAEIVKYDFNNKQKIDTITNRNESIKKTFYYDSLGNNILVFSPASTECFQYLLYKNNQVVTIGNYYNDKIYEIEYNNINNKISELKLNAEPMLKYEYDTQNRLVQINDFKYNRAFVLIQYFE